ncbi:MAG: hypothetical protein HRU14_05125 [Planctomycetes bacterium]|nr:hypothetical protein [Planctomycetota bacterium]
MIRSIVSIQLLVAMCTVLTAQGDGGAAEKASQEQRTVEALRSLSRAEVQKMEAVFQDQLDNGLRILRDTPANADTEAAAEIRKGLAPWASVFPQRFIDIIVKSEEQPDLRAHLVDTLTFAASPEAAAGLAKLIGSGDEYLDMICVQGIGFMSAAADDARKTIVALARTTESDKVMGAALIAMARLGCPEAAALARATIGGEAYSPEVKARAVSALAITQDDPRADARLARKLGQDKNTPKVLRLSVLRALGRYDKNADGRRLLHDALAEEDADIIRAALFALKRVASKESSKLPLFKLVRTMEVDRDLRESAARILMSLGSKDGARHLADPLKRTADGERGNARLQRTAADAYYELRDYDDAIVYYRRALTASSPARKYQYHVAISRCHARTGDFDKAAAELKKAGYDRFNNFDDDPAFKKMRAHPRWAPLFDDGDRDGE